MQLIPISNQTLTKERQMSSIDTRAPFFPNAKTAKADIDQLRNARALRRNSYERTQQLNDQTSTDAKVSIPDRVRDFSRIKKAVDTAPEVDNSAKIARLRSQIQAGAYQPDYDAIADQMLTKEY